MSDRAQIKFRAERSLHDRLLAGAEQSGRSLSEEIKRRLEWSFDADLIQKAVADGIAAHEAAKFQRGVIVVRSEEDSLALGRALTPSLSDDVCYRY